jgi:hypothetical protein
MPRVRRASRFREVKPAGPGIGSRHPASEPAPTGMLPVSDLKRDLRLTLGHWHGRLPLGPAGPPTVAPGPAPGPASKRELAPLVFRTANGELTAGGQEPKCPMLIKSQATRPATTRRRASPTRRSLDQATQRLHGSRPSQATRRTSAGPGSWGAPQPQPQPQRSAQSWWWRWAAVEEGGSAARCARARRARHVLHSAVAAVQGRQRAAVAAVVWQGRRVCEQHL